MGTWQMPLKMPPARVNLTSRSAAGAANLTKRIQDNPDFLKACNGPRPEILGKVGRRSQGLICPAGGALVSPPHPTRTRAR